jgi:polyisoprenoid-binding protein YceI
MFSPRAALPLAAAAVAAIALPSAAGDQLRYALEEDQVFVGYQVAVGKKQVSGVSHALAGSVAASPDGTQVRLRVPVASFTTGFGPADAAMRTALEADKFPSVEFEGRAPATSSDDAMHPFQGTVRIHGVEQPLSVPVKIVRDGKLAFVHASFNLQLSAFGVNRPSVAGAQLGDQVEVQLTTRLHTVPAGTQLASY